MVAFRKSEIGLVPALCFVLFAVSGCTVAKIGARSATPILMNNPTQQVEVIKHFEVSQGIVFDYTASFDAGEILASVLKETGCDGFINVNLELKITPGDFCLNYITCNLARAQHLNVKGDAVKFAGGLGALDESQTEVLEEAAQLQDLTSELLAMSQEDQAGHAILMRHDGDLPYVLVRVKQ